MSSINIKAPGKIILCGEHAVVYGYPAIVMAIDKYLKIHYEWDDKDADLVSWSQNAIANISQYCVPTIIDRLKPVIESDLPTGSGLGSSAAISTSLAVLLLAITNQRITRKRINNIAFELEKKNHGTPSGIDNTIITFGGIIRFQKKQAELIANSHIY